MNRLRIGLDVDGVLADFANPAMEIAKELYPDTDVHNRIWNLGLTNEQADAVMKEVASRKNFFFELDPLPNNEYLTEAQYDHTLFFITARISTKGLPIEEQTANWLRAHYKIYNPTVIVTDSGKDKTKLYDALKLISFVDDRIDTVEQMLATKHQNVFIYDQPWNRSLDISHRVRNIKEYFDDVEAF